MFAAKRINAAGTRGFTLIELLVVLSIIALVLSAGLPSFRQYLQAQQVITSADQFMFALKLARSEAMQRGSRVDLAPLDGTHWERGWHVFVKQPGDSSLQYAAGDQVLHSHTPGLPALRIVTRLSDRSAAYIAYNGNGRARSNASALSRQWGSWQFSVADQVRLIRITLAGRVRLCNPDNDNSCHFSGGDSDMESAP
jgi:type IV fimbrial biogenesis protein FimT